MVVLNNFRIPSKGLFKADSRYSESAFTDMIARVGWLGVSVFCIRDLRLTFQARTLNYKVSVSLGRKKKKERGGRSLTVLFVHLTPRGLSLEMLFAHFRR